MRQLLRWRVGIVAIAAAVAVAAWWVTPLFGSKEAPQQIVACSEAVGPPFAPDEPLEMNSVFASPFFKTVAMEKEVFVCADAGTITQIHDLETFIEIIERPSTRGARVVDKRVEVATCTKDFVADSVGCSTLNLPLRPTEPTLQNCVPPRRPRGARDPIVMNTVNSGSNVKTIKVEKEILECPGLAAIADLYIFTEISEAAVRDPAGNIINIAPVKKVFEGIKCLKELDGPKIRECHSFTPGAPTGVAGPCSEATPPLAPEEPLEMNSVLAGGLFKTVAMEKEVFVCQDPFTGAIRQIHDLETFIEIIERPSSTGATIVDKRVEVATCTKDFVANRVGCSTQNLALEPGRPTLQRCVPHRERSNPRDPVAMNTVNSGTNVKTIKVEKEILDCPDLKATADLYLFTEISEAVVRDPTTGRPVNIVPVRKVFEGIKCLKELDSPKIRECHSFTPLGG